MSQPHISLVPDAPPGFKYSQPTKRDLLRGPVSIFTDSLEHCTALLDDFCEQVSGLLITQENQFGFRKIGPLLWHLAITPAAMPNLQELISFCSRQIETQSKLHEKNTHLETLLDRCRRELDQTWENFHSYESHLAAKVEQMRQEINHRKAIEDQLRLFKMFAENSQQAVGWITLAGHIVYLNPAMALLHGGTDPADFIGHNFLDYYAPEDRKKLTSLITSEIIEKGMWSGELNMMQPTTGERIPTYNNARLIHDSEAGQTYIAAFVTDLREQKRNEQERLKIKQLESIGFLAGGIAHDFNNLLMAILGNLELADMKLPPDSEAVKFLDPARDASLKAKKLTSQLLTFAKGGHPVLKQASISTIIVESAEQILHGQSIAYHYDTPANLFDVDVDPDQMSQAIQNIITNACQAMPDGGTVNITCKNIPDGPRVRITITDSGPGIPADQLEKIFDPYFSTRQNGSGLGLAICLSVITKHGGSITARSQPGEGATFIIDLPAIPGTESQTKETQQQQSIDETPRPTQILIMDDEPTVRQFAHSAFEMLGYDAITARDGKEALQIYRERLKSNQPIDLTFLDLTVPGGMGGKETAAELKKLDSNAVMVVASGYSDDPVMANCRDYGFSAAIAKPFSLAELRSLLKTLT